ncbi:15079_t:CDS:2 [Funneliformis mosseae]|uniref:Probable cytosolic iron-sulfur protein assembly protein 1 n=1 Tax=Funneliformis mosseae TaxID=27381 RepID=A0A9N8UWU6_FUNMO|nr:15079_t:CDS:2 [Funneliformis mosseae]
MSPHLVQIAELKGHADRVWSVSWSPTGNVLASCGGDKTVRLWVPTSEDNPSEWICTNTLEGAHKRTIRNVSWSPSGRQLATASFDALTGIWERDDAGDYECVATLEGHENETKSVAWASSGSLVATCGRDKSVWIWEEIYNYKAAADNDFECISVLQEHIQDVKMVIWHPTNELLASASYDDTIKLWREDDDDWYCSDTLEGHESTVWAIDFDKDGEYLVSASDDKTIKFWKGFPNDNQEGTDAHRGHSKWKCVHTLSGHHTRCVYSVSWSKVHGRIASGSADNVIRVFDKSSPNDINPSNFSLVASIPSAHGVADVNCVQWYPTERHSDWLASAGDDGIVRIWRFVE